MFHEQKKNTRILALCGMAMTSLLLWGCGGNMSPTGQVAERSDYYTRLLLRPAMIIIWWRNWRPTDESLSSNRSI